MKKFGWIVILVGVFFAGSSVWGMPALRKVKLSETVRSVFYTPQYVAMSQGFFRKAGLEIDLSTAWGSDKGAAALVSGSVDFSLIGPEAALYVYNQGAQKYLIAFAQLTKGDGSFLVARKPIPDFEWRNLKGKAIIGGRKGGVPEMVLEYVLKANGLTPQTEVTILQNIDFTATAGAFKSGTGDFIALFEPTVSLLEKEGVAYPVASFRVAAGVLPYTAYHARKDFLAKNPKLVQVFTNAIYQGQIWVQNHTPEQIAGAIKSFFPDIPAEILVKAIKRYQTQDTWAQNPVLTKAAFNRLQEIVRNGGELKQSVPYERMVNTVFAIRACKEIQE